MKKKLNCSEAKVLDIVQFLTNEGFNPVKATERYCWYLSPLRADKIPSFRVNRKLNLWYDFGIGEGGDIIKLVELMMNVDTSQALDHLNKCTFFSCQPAFKITEEPDGNHSEVLHAQNISHSALFEYLKSRGIKPTIADKYLREVHFQIDSKKYFGLGLRNKMNGWEIRNKYWKSCIGNKSISLISNKCSLICVYEGMFDFLSLISLVAEIEKNADHLIMNSTALIKKAISILSNYKSIFIFLDNDKSGKDATLVILNSYPTAKDYSAEYAVEQDLNDFLLSPSVPPPQMEAFKIHLRESLHQFLLKQRKMQFKQRNRPKGMNI